MALAMLSVVAFRQVHDGVEKRMPGFDLNVEDRLCDCGASLQTDSASDHFAYCANGHLIPLQAETEDQPDEGPPP